MSNQTIICPPRAMAAVSGAVLCRKTARRTTLTYSDGTKETVNTAALEKLPVDWDNWFSIVSHVQSFRRNTGEPKDAFAARAIIREWNNPKEITPQQAARRRRGARVSNQTTPAKFVVFTTPPVGVEPFYPTDILPGGAS